MLKLHNFAYKLNIYIASYIYWVNCNDLFLIMNHFFSGIDRLTVLFIFWLIFCFMVLLVFCFMVLLVFCFMVLLVFWFMVLLVFWWMVLLVFWFMVLLIFGWMVLLIFWWMVLLIFGLIFLVWCIFLISRNLSLSSSLLSYLRILLSHSCCN